MKLICKINKRISIWADQHQYIVRIQKNPKQKVKHSENRYFPTLEMCFEEIFECLCKTKLADGRDKGIEDIAKIIIQTKREIMEIMQPLEGLSKGRQEAEEGGK